MEKMKVGKNAYASPRVSVFALKGEDVVTASGITETATPIDVDVQWNELWTW